MVVGRLFPSNRTPMDAAPLLRLERATTTPVRTFILLREAPSSFKRTRSPGLSSIDVMRPSPSILASTIWRTAGVRDLPLTVADLALDGINFTTWLHWLRHDWVAHSIAGRADMLFDLRTFHDAHLEPSVRSFADHPSGLRLQPQLYKPAGPQ
jgi:hypothetical protein